MRYMIPALIAAGIFIATAAWPSCGWSQAPNWQESSYIKPFPQDNIYRLQLIGDDYAGGLRSYMAEAMLDIGLVRTESSVLQISSLRRSGWNNEVTKIAAALAKQPIDIAVVMLGTAEFGSVFVSGNRIRQGSEAWREEYTARVDLIMKALKQNNTAVYWIGIPTMPNERQDDNARTINEILRERAYINNVRYIDTYAGFADEEGGYDAYGPDLTGKNERLRSNDGIYFTTVGYRKLAHFAKRDIAIDIRSAVSEREIPLAGSELEQERINHKFDGADRAASGEELEIETRQRQGAPRRLSSDANSGPSSANPEFGLEDQRSDNSNIRLRTVKYGIAKTDTVEILRPAIPATLLAILTRGYAANKKKSFGQNVQVELPTGVILMHTITPLSQGGNKRQQTQFSLSQSPFFRVLMKGQRLVPRPGRSDDIEWPRPEPQPVVRAKAALQPNDVPGRPAYRARPSRKYTPEGFPPLPEAKPRFR